MTTNKVNVSKSTVRPDGYTSKRKFKQVSADFLNLNEVGDSAEGEIMDILDMHVRDKTRPGIVLKRDDGKILKVPLTDNAKADLATLSRGDYIRVSLKELVDTHKGQPAKVFFFEKAEDEE